MTTSGSGRRQRGHWGKSAITGPLQLWSVSSVTEKLSSGSRQPQPCSSSETGMQSILCVRLRLTRVLSADDPCGGSYEDSKTPFGERRQDGGDLRMPGLQIWQGSNSLGNTALRTSGGWRRSE